ncbi:MAG TPA: AMP-binding protein, partial [Deltaproteobacteria bacterium]|nr:AMP-binding protein [Deltaproteobacteria bacterium]
MSSFWEITMGGLIRQTASRYPDNDALIYPETGLRLTYRELLAKCTETAKGFMALGVKNGDHVS